MNDAKHNPDPGPSIVHVFDCTHNPCQCLRPEEILIQLRRDGLWAFSIAARNGKVLDSSLSSSRWLCWRMAKTSWRHYGGRR